MTFDLRTCVVRVGSLAGTMGGTGFVVAEDLAVTCAHVVQVLGVGPGDRVRLRFHVGGEQEAEVLTDGWHPEEDLAFLRLTNALPDSVGTAVLGASAPATRHAFTTFGYPDVRGQVEAYEGIWAEGTILRQVAATAGQTGLQIRAHENTPDMSGAPLWNVEMGRVVGMVKENFLKDAAGKLRDAWFAVSAETIVSLSGGELMLGPSQLKSPSPPLVTITGEGNIVGDHSTVYQIIQKRYPHLKDAMYNVSTTIETVTEGFVGRTFVFDWLDAHLTTLPCGYLRLIADAGLGKTAIAAEVARRYDATVHFVSASEGVTRSDQCLNHLAARLIARYGLDHDHLPERAGQDTNFLRTLLQEAAKNDGGPVLIVIDALDEADPVAGGRNWLLLPSHLPEGVFILLTQRPGEYPITVDARTPQPESLTIAWDDPRQQGDLAAYLWRQVERPGIRRTLREAAPPIAVDRFVDGLKRFAEGNFKYLEYVLSDLLSCEPGFDPLDLQGLPRGLRGYYAHFWAQMRPEQDASESEWEAWETRHLPLLEALGVAGEPVTRQWLADHTGLPFRTVRRILAGWRRFLRCERRADGTPTWRIVHHSFADFLTEKMDLSAAHRRVVSWYLEAWGGWEPNLPQLETGCNLHNGYGLRHLIVHLGGTFWWDYVRALLMDFDWLWTKLRATNLDALFADYDVAFSLNSPLNGNRAIRLVQGALQLSAYVLVHDSNQLPGQILGRLTSVHKDDIQILINQIEKFNEISWLQPVIPSLTPPGGPLLRTLTSQEGWINALGVSPDGKIIVSASDRRLQTWSFETGKLLYTFVGHTRKVNSVTITPGGDWIISGSSDGIIKIWNLVCGEEIKTLKGHKRRIMALAMIRDNVLISASEDTNLKVWDLESGRSIYTLTDHNSKVRSVAVIPGKMQAVSGSSAGVLNLWDLKRGSLEFSWRVNQPINTLAIFREGRYAILGLSNGVLLIWDLECGKEASRLVGHKGSINSVAVTTDGKKAVSVSNDATIRVWNLERESNLAVLRGHRSVIQAIEILPGRERAISGSSDGTIKIWSLEEFRETRYLGLGHSKRVNDLAITPDGKQAISGSSDQTLKLWSLERYSGTKTLKGHTDWVWGVKIASAGKHVVSASEDGTLKVWDIKRAVEIHTLKGHKGRIRALAITPDGNMAVSASDDRTLIAWNLENGLKHKVFVGHVDWVGAVAITPNGEFLISGSDDRTLRIWDLVLGKEVSRLKGHTRPITQVMVDSRGQRIISASLDGVIRIWDLNEMVALKTLTAHSKSITDIVTTWDGKYIVSASKDNTVKLWDLANGVELRRFNGHTASVNAIAVVPNKYIISASADHTLKVWNLTMGCMIGTFTTESPLYTCAVTPNGRTVVTGDASGRMHFLKLVEAGSGG